MTQIEPDPNVMRMLQEGSGGSEDPISELNVIPFIDICLVLLIIVLIMSTFSYQLFNFDNPSSAEFTVVNAQTKEGESTVIKLFVHSKEKITLNGKVITLNSVAPELNKIWQGGKYSAVEFRAPNKMNIQDVIYVMEKVRMNVKDVKLSLAILEE
ncbi:MAG: biopolymer transporter ExbD [Lentisphaeria bacterium]|nr:biopolymer transporter ExbD [Lentisphaeria bacterium]NQZ68750.1 biopolymer transporter ExbD [Lentisphaeria bacterium]